MGVLGIGNLSGCCFTFVGDSLTRNCKKNGLKREYGGQGMETDLIEYSEGEKVQRECLRDWRERQ